MSGFVADAERLAEGARDLQGLAGRAREISAELTRVLDASGAPWGTDIVGLSFAAAHAGPAAETLQRTRALAEALDDIGARFAGTASAYRAVDDAAASESGA